jgi:UDP-2-acetamido-3-amino-2,3-dideoxy-glucuronate N-acetyltransferase
MNADPGGGGGTSPGSSVSGAVFVHPSAIVDAGASIGEGTRIWHFCHVMSGARLGRDVSMGQNGFVAGGAVVGDGCRLQNNVSVYEGVELEEQVFCGPSMVFTNDFAPRAFVDRRTEWRRTIVRRGASLGANCTVVCGNEIGEYAMVAAGAVVTHPVTAYRLVAGVPARPLGWVCRCGEVLTVPAGPGPSTTTCSRCDSTYVHHQGQLTPSPAAG